MYPRCHGNNLATFLRVTTINFPADLLAHDAVWNFAGSVFALLLGDRMFFKFVKR